MEVKDLFIDLMFLNVCRLYKKCRSRPRIRKWAIRPTNKDRYSGGYYRKVFLPIKEDEEQLFAHTRMSRAVYEALLKFTRSALQKSRQKIYAEERLSLTLLHLAQGTSLQSLANSYKLGKTTVRNIVLETCEVLWRLLSPIYVSEPTVSQYEEIADGFKYLWNVPNCVGAVNGKHIVLKCPKTCASQTDNTPNQISSIVLLAACDAHYRFTSIAVESNGNQKDGGIFHISRFGKALVRNELQLPADAPLFSTSTETFPHYFVGDIAFPLMNNIMRPYPAGNLTPIRKHFNQKLSAAHRVIENSFGILTARWQILRNTIECSADNCKTIVLACIALHNFIMTNDQLQLYCPEKFADWQAEDHVMHDGNWRTDGPGGSLSSISSSLRRGPTSAIELRDTLANHFANEAAI